MIFKINMDTNGSKYATIPAELRGEIKGTTKNKRDVLNRKGGDQTNEAYAKENGITKRQASKLRRGY
jgi:phage-related minor tail protein